jgi:hypothetical protein
MTFEDAVEALENALKELEEFHGSGSSSIHRHSAQRLADTMQRLEKLCVLFIGRVRDDL